MAKKKKNQKPAKSFEQNLWDTADKLRGKVESSEYKHVVLSLIFLKFISDKFEKRKAELIEEGNAKNVDMVEFYAMKNVFYLPEEARWSFIQKNATQEDIAVKIDTALHTVEKNNKSLRGALPDNYFSRLGLDESKLAALIDSLNNIDTVEDKEGNVVGRANDYYFGKFSTIFGDVPADALFKNEPVGREADFIKANPQLNIPNFHSAPIRRMKNHRISHLKATHHE